MPRTQSAQPAGNSKTPGAIALEFPQPKKPTLAPCHPRARKMHKHQAATLGSVHGYYRWRIEVARLAERLALVGAAMEMEAAGGGVIAYIRIEMSDEL